LKGRIRRNREEEKGIFRFFWREEMRNKNFNRFRYLVFDVVDEKF